MEYVFGCSHTVKKLSFLMLAVAGIYVSHPRWAYAVEAQDCDPAINLIQNGSFETPVVTDTHHWDIYDSGFPGLGWTVEWMNAHGPFNGFAQPDPAKLEIQAGVDSWPAADGSQYAELDSDWNGPSSGVTLNLEPANIRIYQDIATIPGDVYQVHFSHSPRPHRVAATNDLKFFWDNTEQGDFSADGGDAPSWTEETYQFTATQSVTRIAFTENGTEDSLGSFLDAVKVACIQECDENADCQDGNPCTQDLCVEGICQNNNFDAGTSCEDGNLCNGAETCDGAGHCDAGTEVTCENLGTCYNDSICEAATGACVPQPKAEGSSCGDGDACNGDEQCDGNGACIAGTPVTCDDGNPCTVEHCGESGECVTDPAPSTTSCADLDPCNGEEFCDGNGACAPGTAVDCDDLDRCTDNICNHADGTCSNPDNGLCAVITDNPNGGGSHTDSTVGSGVTPLNDPFGGNGVTVSPTVFEGAKLGCSLQQNPAGEIGRGALIGCLSVAMFLISAMGALKVRFCK